MPRKRIEKKKKPFPLLPTLAIAVVAGVILAVGGFGFAASQEAHDSFCASCHTQPESTFYQRSTSQAVDLASFHQPQKGRCIDCHSGQGVFGRVSAELMGARNAARWYSGTAVQPAPLTYPIGDENCLKCHADVVQQYFTPKEQISIGAGGFEGGGRLGNHWHEFLLRWQAASPNAQGCVDCHTAHTTGSSAQAGFMDNGAVQAICDNCHQVLRQDNGG